LRLTRPHLFLTPARPGLLGGIRQALQSAQKEGYRGLIALFLGALPGQMRRSRVSGSLELGLCGAFQVCLALGEKPMKNNSKTFMVKVLCFLIPMFSSICYSRVEIERPSNSQFNIDIRFLDIIRPRTTGLRIPVPQNWVVFNWHEANYNNRLRFYALSSSNLDAVDSEAGIRMTGFSGTNRNIPFSKFLSNRLEYYNSQDFNIKWSIVTNHKNNVELHRFICYYAKTNRYPDCLWADYLCGSLNNEHHYYNIESWVYSNSVRKYWYMFEYLKAYLKIE
jgi:hypothetical protein